MLQFKNKKGEVVIKENVETGETTFLDESLLEKHTIEEAIEEADEKDSAKKEDEAEK